MTYSVFAEKLQEYRNTHTLATDVPIETQNKIWDEVLKNNIFVICKTEMAKSITKRTLRGFRQAKVNARYFEDLINKITNQQQLFLGKVVKGKQYWNNYDIEDNMKFNAIVGNPPYQEETKGAGRQARPLYNKFVDISRLLSPEYLSMVMPSRWFAGGMGLDSFRESMLNDKRIIKLIDYTNSKDCFPQISISGGVCYFLWSKSWSGNCSFTNIINGTKQSMLRPLNEFDVLVRYNTAVDIIRKVKKLNENLLADISSSLMPFGLGTDVRGKNEKN